MTASRARFTSRREALLARERSRSRTTSARLSNLNTRYAWGHFSLLGLGIFDPGIANDIVSGGPQLGAGAAVDTGLAAGGAIVAGADLAAGGAGLPVMRWWAGGGGAATVATGPARPTEPEAWVVSPAQAARRSSPLHRMTGSLGGASSTTDAAPPWARRMKRAHTVNQAVSAATQSVRSGDSAAADPPLSCPRESTDVQKTIRALSPYAQPVTSNAHRCTCRTSLPRSSATRSFADETALTCPD
jgi:hypothetical protein